MTESELFKAQTEGSFEVTNPELVREAWAVVYGLGGVMSCRGCGQRCVSYSFVENDPDGIAIAVCPGCFREFRGRHGLHAMKMDLAVRVMRYAAFKGWLTNDYARWVEYAQPSLIDGMARRDGKFRMRAF